MKYPHGSGSGSGSATLPEDGDGGGDGGVGAEDELWGGGEGALQVRHLVQVDVGGVGAVVLEHAAPGVGRHQPSKANTKCKKRISQ